MSLFRASAADRFRWCPFCGSSAVRTVSHAPVGTSLHRWSVRCGQCQSRRAGVFTKRETRELLCRLASDRACIEEALGRSRWTDPAHELGPPSRSPRGARQRPPRVG